MGIVKYSQKEHIKSMKILAISDTVIEGLYSGGVTQRFAGTELVISCGDLPYAYPEYLLSMLNAALFYVRGNHDVSVQNWQVPQPGPLGGFDLHKKITRFNGLLLAGIEGSLRYRDGPFMYSQNEMWMNVFELIPGLIVNRMRYGRFLDIFVTHAPPFGIHDEIDLPHQGIKAFTWFDRVFSPKFHLHGHIHIYNHNVKRETVFDGTRIINCYGYQEITV